MKRIAISALADCLVMATADVVFLSFAINGMPDGTSMFSRIAVGLGPGFLALPVVYLFCAPRSRAQVSVALALLLVRFLVYDNQFGAPKRAELDRDVTSVRQAGHAVPGNYYRALGDINQAYLAAGVGCMAGMAAAFGAYRRRTLGQTAATQ